MCTHIEDETRRRLIRSHSRDAPIYRIVVAIHDSSASFESYKTPFENNRHSRLNNPEPRLWCYVSRDTPGLINARTLF